jgi:hypothetical protein
MEIGNQGVRRKRLSYLAVALLLELVTIILCPLGNYCGISGHPVWCLGALNSFIHRELFPTAVRTGVGTLVNGDYGYDLAVDWTRNLTIAAAFISLVCIMRKPRKSPNNWHIVWILFPLTVHWVCLMAFYGVAGQGDGCKL